MGSTKRSRALVPGLLALAVLAAAAGPSPRATAVVGWQARIEGLVGSRTISVSVGERGRFLYRHLGTAWRVPASVQKLCMAMALLDRVGPQARIATDAAAVVGSDGVIVGDLWIVGHGDPTTAAGQMGALARRLADAGVTAVEGSVMGDTSTFSRDWWASGWKRYFVGDEVAIPTALTFRGNRLDGGQAITDPEIRAASALTTSLEGLGVEVAGAPGSGAAPQDVSVLASARSKPVRNLLANVLATSDNFGAEVLGKGLAWFSEVRPATIPAGAALCVSYAQAHGVTVRAFDSSGLSYENRMTTSGLVRLLGDAERQPWGTSLMLALPDGGQGTLKYRLRDVDVHAKTGTVSSISSLAGWVWSNRRGAWLEFAILSAGMSKSTAVALEDEIVRIIASEA